MSTNRKVSETQTLEKYRISLENVENQTEIATTMPEYGYDVTAISVGKELLAIAQNAYDNNQTEDDEKSEAYNNFALLKEQVASTYKQHRRKAKVIFRKDAISLEKLELLGSVPSAYLKWLGIVKKFYTVINEDEALLIKLTRLKITADVVLAATTKITSLDMARSQYIIEKGESQQATKEKNTALANIDDWMNEFYEIAKIAFEDQPQLVESLGVFTRS